MKNYKLKKMIHEKRERLFAILMLLGFCFLMSSAAFAQGVSSMEKVTIVLLEDNQLQDEVVVVGFCVQKKVNLTDSVAVADRRLIESRSLNNTISA